MENDVRQMKTISFDLSRFQVAEKIDDEYGHYVKLTCMLLFGHTINKQGKKVCKKGEYMRFHGMLEKEHWTLEEIKRYYINATKHHGSVTPQISWWAARKRRNAV